MLKTVLYFIAVVLLMMSCYFGFYWYISEPNNKEPLPALFSFLSSLITLIIGWKIDQKSSTNNVKVEKTKGKSIVDIDPKDNTNYNVVNTKKGSRVFIGKGRKSLKGNSDQNN
ncbi:MAG: hypothetical protein AB8F78_17960 [Saprospiraceae bacterium]